MKGNVIAPEDLHNYIGKKLTDNAALYPYDIIAVGVDYVKARGKLDARKFEMCDNYTWYEWIEEPNDLQSIIDECNWAVSKDARGDYQTKDIDKLVMMIKKMAIIMQGMK